MWVPPGLPSATDHAPNAEESHRWRGPALGADATSLHTEAERATGHEAPESAGEARAREGGAVLRVAPVGEAGIRHLHRVRLLLDVELALGHPLHARQRGDQESDSGSDERLLTHSTPR